MFESNDEAFLVRQIAQNNCVLFLGAGFCWEMKNRLDQRVPLGRELANELWSYCGYSGALPSGMNLSKVFQLAMKSGRPMTELQLFLEDRLLVSDVPDKYDVFANAFWFRIYTTNVDDSLARVFSRAAVMRLDETIYPSATVGERDQFLDRLQCIYLHGRLPCAPDQLTFSVRQYAKRAGGFDRLYDVFVGDYATRPTIFLGTELDEPVFYQYLEAREGRGEAARENRPRSFLIAPGLSKASTDLLDEFNIVGVSATTSDFISWLKSVLPKFPTKTQLLESKTPTLSMLRSRLSVGSVGDRALKEFSAAFHAVPLVAVAGKEKSKYLLGSSPRWEDIHQELDVPREITQELVAEIEVALDEKSKLSVLALLGTAGCGKSTILRRLGLTLAQRGHSCYLSNCEEMPSIRDVVSVLDGVSARTVLLFDNAEGALGYISKLAEATAGLRFVPICVVASRSNDFYRKFSHVKLDGEIQEEVIPNLVRKEIDGLLGVLETNGLLGKLRAMTYDARVREFTNRSGKQILVAMREATEGRGFDEILNSEYEALESDEAKVLYLCVALCTGAGYRLEKSEFVRCAHVEPAVALDILERQLLGMVLKTGQSDGLLLLRHRRIAEFFVMGAAPRVVLSRAYERLLPVLVPTADEVAGQSRRFRLYRELINHQTLFERFSSQPNLPRTLYDMLTPIVGSDPHFFLQYGCYEMQRGEYEFASNYLHQARAMDPGNRFVINAQGQLLLKRAIAADSREAANSLRAEGKQLLVGNNDVWGHYDAHYYSILGIQEFLWVKRWCIDNDERARCLEDVLDFVKRGLREFPRSKELVELQEQAKEEYLRCSIPRRN